MIDLDVTLEKYLESPTEDNFQEYNIALAQAHPEDVWAIQKGIKIAEKDGISFYEYLIYLFKRDLYSREGREGLSNEIHTYFHRTND